MRQVVLLVEGRPARERRAGGFGNHRPSSARLPLAKLARLRYKGIPLCGPSFCLFTFAFADFRRDAMRTRLIPAALAYGLLFVFVTSARCAQNLVYNGDFEMASAQGRVLGWTMWGNDASSSSGSYALDTVNPHDGRACLRVHHPSGSDGYVVSSAEHSLRPRRAMSYTITFWARADKLGMSRFAGLGLFRWSALPQTVFARQLHHRRRGELEAFPLHHRRGLGLLRGPESRSLARLLSHLREARRPYALG